MKTYSEGYSEAGDKLFYRVKKAEYIKRRIQL
jgi:hypothetical protein